MSMIILLMLCGVAVGFAFRRRRLGFIRYLVTLLIWLLLFILGVEVGSDKQIIKGLHALGLEALLIALGGTSGSIAAAWVLWKCVTRKGRGEV